jgi:hypothetical protein
MKRATSLFACLLVACGSAPPPVLAPTETHASHAGWRYEDRALELVPHEPTETNEGQLCGVTIAIRNARADVCTTSGAEGRVYCMGETLDASSATDQRVQIVIDDGVREVALRALDVHELACLDRVLVLRLRPQTPSERGLFMISSANGRIDHGWALRASSDAATPVMQLLPLTHDHRAQGAIVWGANGLRFDLGVGFVEATGLHPVHETDEAPESFRISPRGEVEAVYSAH